MVLAKKQFGEITDSYSIDESFVTSSKKLDAIIASCETSDAAKDLSLEQSLAERLIYMEQHHLSITSSNTDFIMSYGNYILDALSAYVLRKYEDSVFHLEAAEISTLCASEQKLLCRLGES